MERPLCASEAAKKRFLDLAAPLQTEAGSSELHTEAKSITAKAGFHGEKGEKALAAVNASLKTIATVRNRVEEVLDSYPPSTPSSE